MRLHVGIFQNINIAFEICANPFKITPANHLKSICTGAAGAQLWKASWLACGAHLLIKSSLRPNCLASWQACGQQSPCPRQNARCAVCARMTSYVDPYGSYMDPYMDPYMDTTWIPIWIPI